MSAGELLPLAPFWLETATVEMSNANKKKIRVCFIRVIVGLFEIIVCVSMAKFISHDLAVLHDEANALELSDVGDRIAGDRDQISEFPRLNRADAILPAQHFRGVGRNGTNHVEGGHPGFMQSRKS